MLKKVNQLITSGAHHEIAICNKALELFETIESGRRSHQVQKNAVLSQLTFYK
jgi:hypothetical protein